MMKKLLLKIAIYCIPALMLPVYASAQMGSAPKLETSMIEETYTGKWKFEAPEAPEGSTKGDIEIRPDRVIMRFNDALEFPSTWVKFRNDSIIYRTDFDAASVVFSLKIHDKKNMSGKAVWEGGESAFILIRNLGARL